MAENRNPLNKDAKYDARIAYWRREIEEQIKMTQEANSEIESQNTRRKELQDDIQLVLDRSLIPKLEAEIQAINKEKRETDKLHLIISEGRKVAEAEIDRLNEKKIQSAAKADKEWEKAKKKGIYVKPYVPTEEEKKPRTMVPASLIVANYFLARQQRKSGSGA